MNRSFHRTLWSIAAASMLLLAPVYGQASGTSLKTLAGSWKVTVTPDGVPPFQAFNQFNADGTSVEFDNSNPAGQQTIAVGPWERTGNNEYMMLEVNQLFDDHGYAGEFVVQAKITLDDSGNSFTSAFTFRVLDISENVVFQGTGTATGSRITIDSLARFIP